MTSKDKNVRASGCPTCGSNDIQGLHGDLRQCLNCASTINGDGTVDTEGAVDSTARVLGTTPAQPLPEEALVEQEGAADLDRVRGLTPPQPLPEDAFNDPRVLGTTPPQPLPADAGKPAPTAVYGDSTGAVSDTPPDTHGDPVNTVEEPAPAKPLTAKAAAKVDGSVGDQPVTDQSYSVTSGFPTGETKVVTPGKKPQKPKTAKP